MNRKLFKFTTLSLALIALAIVYNNKTSSSQDDGFTVSYIDVGQGNSTLIQDPNGFDILIDGGKVSAGPIILDYLREQGVNTLEVMVASHADADRIGGLIDVLEATDITVLSVLYNGYPGNTQTWNDFVTTAANDGLYLQPLQFPVALSWGMMNVYVLNPLSGLINPEQNNASVVLLVDDYDVEFLITGDIDSTAEAEIVARGTPVAADILQVAHHGSRYSSGADFLAAVQPKEAVISVGDNSYGHPSAETLARLTAAGAQIWRTDQQGTIVITTDGSTYNVFVTFQELLQYLSIILNEYPEPPQFTPTPTSTGLPPFPTPTATQPAPPQVIDVRISYIFFDGAVPYVESDEYAQITNYGTTNIDLAGWRLNAGDPGQDFIFPSYNIQPGQSCSVYTNEYHPESCGFSFGSSSAIWNNNGDCGYLYDNEGQLVSTYCY